ncbi:hypothetical protein TNCT_494841 [Trichonephila clavata]|uniref:Uncharacterized protein n=1 Tax=Trichonephila clavata TaxID=2740835 RepID=A0A8X6FSB6_TRICU|nr:hypothetical protein TNCT_494841 [Trichonephila clavata]
MKTAGRSATALSEVSHSANNHVDYLLCPDMVNLVTSRSILDIRGRKSIVPLRNVIYLLQFNVGVAKPQNIKMCL